MSVAATASNQYTHTHTFIYSFNFNFNLRKIVLIINLGKRVLFDNGGLSCVKNGGWVVWKMGVKFCENRSPNPGGINGFWDEWNGGAGVFFFFGKKDGLMEFKIDVFVIRIMFW